MSLLDKFRRSPAPGAHMEFLTNLSEVDKCGFVNGLEETNAGRSGCPLSSTPTPKEKTMTNNGSRARIDAMKDENAALRLKAVKLAIETGTQIYENRQKAEEQALNDVLKKSGLHFVD